MKEGYREGDIVILFKKKDCILCFFFYYKFVIENSLEFIVVSFVFKYSGLERFVVVFVDIDDGIIWGCKKKFFIYGVVIRGMVKLVIIWC